MSAPAGRLRVGVVCDYREEGWPSMDLVGSMLLRSLAEEHVEEIDASAVLPAMVPRFRRLPVVGSRRQAMNADRMIGRFVDYPRHLKSRRASFDLFHIVDHSYAHLVHALPPGRTVVTCHDLDTFRSVLEPERVPRSLAFRAMTRRILTGMQRAAFVTCDSVATRDDLLKHGLLPDDRSRVVPLGVDPAMSPAPDAVADASVSALLGPPGRHTDILHVGSTIPRKRIDVLLRLFARVRAEVPSVRLVRAGGPFTEAQTALARELGIPGETVVVLPFLRSAELAAVYRRAAVVVQPSEAEGFGLPVVEAMACGAQVIASDLPVLREVGGAVARYCAVADVAGWARAVVEALRSRTSIDGQRQATRDALRQAARFSWSRFGDEVVEVYRQVARHRDRSNEMVRA